MTVQANDLHRPLILFWQALKSQLPQVVAAAARVWRDFHLAAVDEDTGKRRFHELKAQLAAELDPVEAAGIFWLVVRRAFKGRAMVGGYGHSLTERNPRFYPKRFNRCVPLLREKFTFTNMDYARFLDDVPLADDPSTLIFVDPPYLQMDEDGKILPPSMYTFHAPFQERQTHEALRDRLARYRYWMLVHEDNAVIRDVYKEYKIIEVEMPYGKGEKKKVKPEILVLGHGHRRVE